MTLMSIPQTSFPLEATESQRQASTEVSRNIQHTHRTLMMRIHFLTLMLGVLGILLAYFGLAPGSNARVNGQLLNATLAIGLSLPAFVLAAFGRVQLSIYFMIFSAVFSVLNVTLNIGFGLRAPAFAVLALACLTITCFFGLKMGRWASGLSVFYVLLVYFLQRHELIIGPTVSSQPLPTATVISHLLLFIGTALLCQTFRDQGDIAAKELQRQNTALQEAKDKRLSLLAERQKFLGNMAHNIRTPISIIQSALTLIEHPRNQGKKITRYTATLKVETKKLGKLLAQYSDVIAIRDHQLQLNVSTCNPVQVLNTLCLSYNSQFQGKGISLRWLATGTVPEHWHVDVRRMQQMAVAFIENALKYTEHGTVWAELKMQTQGDGSQRLVFSVTDQGLGLSPDALQELFKPFTQAATNSANTLEGIGLSLYITRCLAQAMGGEVGAESNENEGTCFWFSLPDALPHETQVTM